MPGNLANRVAVAGQPDQLLVAGILTILSKNLDRLGQVVHGLLMLWHVELVGQVPDAQDFPALGGMPAAGAVVGPGAVVGEHVLKGTVDRRGQVGGGVGGRLPERAEPVDGFDQGQHAGPKQIVAKLVLGRVAIQKIRQLPTDQRLVGFDHAVTVDTTGTQGSVKLIS